MCADIALKFLVEYEQESGLWVFFYRFSIDKGLDCRKLDTLSITSKAQGLRSLGHMFTRYSPIMERNWGIWASWKEQKLTKAKLHTLPRKINTHQRGDSACRHRRLLSFQILAKSAWWLRHQRIFLLVCAAGASAVRNSLLQTFIILPIAHQARESKSPATCPPRGLLPYCRLLVIRCLSSYQL